MSKKRLLVFNFSRKRFAKQGCFAYKFPVLATNSNCLIIVNLPIVLKL